MKDTEKKFWNWIQPSNLEEEPEAERILELNGTIAAESWFEDDVTPQMFKEELLKGSGPVTVWINSPGGDCIAASQIYTMLMDYAGPVTVKIDGIAASAASVIAMAGEVKMAPTALMMIHNPATLAWGDSDAMQKAMEMLNEVKESIINAYELKTGLPRVKLSHLMDNETWMNAKKAMELGFADGMLLDEKREQISDSAFTFSGLQTEGELVRKLVAKFESEKEPPRLEPETEPEAKVKTETGTTVNSLEKRLFLLRP